MAMILKMFDPRTASIIAIDLTVIGSCLMAHGKKPVVSFAELVSDACEGSIASWLMVDNRP